MERSIVGEKQWLAKKKIETDTKTNIPKISEESEKCMNLFMEDKGQNEKTWMEDHKGSLLLYHDLSPHTNLSKNCKPNMEIYQIVCYFVLLTLVSINKNA